MMVAATSIHLFLRLPNHKYPMYGDDFLGVQVGQLPLRSGGFFENVWLVGGGKWRPITTPLLLFLGNRWGYSYTSFQILNSVLLISASVLAGAICLKLSAKLSLSVLATSTVVVSHFNWFAQISIYGSMELLAIIFLLGSILVAFGEELNSRQVGISVLFLTLSTFCHERYILCSLVFVAYFLKIQKTRVEQIGAWTPLLVPILHIALKSFVLNLNPLAGGGESNLRDGAGLWIIQHFADALKMLVGWYSGAGHFYSGDRLGDLAERDKIGLGGSAPVVVLLFLMILLLLLHTKDDHNRRVQEVHKSDIAMLLFGVAVVCLIPAATVVERIEARWMFASQILLILGLASCVGWIRSFISLFLACLVSLSYLVLGVVYLDKSESYTVLRDQPTSVLARLAQQAPASEHWSVVITQTDSKVSSAWQFGYGSSLSQLPNPPYFVNITSDPTAGCIQGLVRLPCLKVSLRGLAVIGDIRFEEASLTGLRD